MAGNHSSSGSAAGVAGTLPKPRSCRSAAMVTAYWPDLNACEQRTCGRASAARRDNTRLVTRAPACRATGFRGPPSPDAGRNVCIQGVPRTCSGEPRRRYFRRAEIPFRDGRDAIVIHSRVARPKDPAFDVFFVRHECFDLFVCTGLDDWKISQQKNRQTNEISSTETQTIRYRYFCDTRKKKSTDFYRLRYLKRRDDGHIFAVHPVCLI